MTVIVKKSINNFDLMNGLVNLMATVWQWHFRWQSRRQLAALDDRCLQAIGVSREAAVAEAKKAFWQ